MPVSELIQRSAESIEASSIAQAISTSDYWFPNLETIHVIGLALMVGTIAFVDLRLLGLASIKRSVRDVSRQMLPIAWVGFAIALVSGSFLFASAAVRYVDNTAFQLKFLLLALAGLNMLVFHFVTWRSIGEWDNNAQPPAGAKTAGAISLASWIAIVFLGRWIGFL